MTRDRAIQQAKALKILIELADASKILGTFIKAFENYSINDGNGNYNLHGNFNLTGTKTGRMSSNSPNMQNLPSGSAYGKLIKGCFTAPHGWVMCGADSASLEDRISALTTRDPNKLKVYTDGYDGHCLRAYSYFQHAMSDIIDTVTSINSIGSKYKKLRQRSKGPTFALTYGGTAYALVNQCGIPPDEAESIETAYHELYKVSDDWVKAKLQQAASDGHVTGAFGLKLRTPILARTIANKSSTPKEAQAEGRTAGNMLGQSYCMLTGRAANEFMARVWESRYRYDIRPIAQIHDAIYLVVRDQVGIVKWVNNNLIECMEWQDLPELQHDEVKLGAELELYYKTWADPINIKNGASKQEIMSACL